MKTDYKKYNLLKIYEAYTHLNVNIIAYLKTFGFQ